MSWLCVQVAVCPPQATGVMQGAVAGDVAVTGAVALQVDVEEQGSAPALTAERWQRTAMMQVCILPNYGN